MKKLIILTLVVTSLTACTSSTEITSSWRAPKISRSYHTIMIAGLTHSVEAKSIIEKDLAEALAAKGITAYKSMDYFAPNFTKDIQREDMMKRIRTIGADAIITASIVDRETQPSYVPGSPMMYPPIGYRGFWGYYNYSFPIMYSPGYYQQDRIYYIETNVYDTHTEELIWSAQSKSYNPPDLSGFSADLADRVVTKLQKDGIIGAAHLKLNKSKSTASRLQNNP